MPSWRQATWVAMPKGTRWRASSKTRTTRPARSPRGHSKGSMSAILSRPGRWLVLLRAGLVVFSAIAVGVTHFPPGYEPWAWAVVGFFALVTVASGVLSALELDRTARAWARGLLIVCDGLIAIGFVAVFSYQTGEPYRALYLIPIAEAALRFGLVGGLIG